MAAFFIGESVCRLLVCVERFCCTNGDVTARIHCAYSGNSYIVHHNDCWRIGTAKNKAVMVAHHFWRSAWVGEGFSLDLQKIQTDLILSYGLGCGLGGGLSYGCTMSNVVKLFLDKRGLAGGG